MDQLTFVTTVFPGRSLFDLHLLLASLRDFGGEQANAPVWVCIPENLVEVPTRVQEHFTALDVGLLKFQADTRIQSFPFGARVQAAYVAEKALAGKSNFLAWLDSDTIILQEPDEFLLPPGIILGCRPVHHRLLGTRWGEALDPFWELVYLKCRASFDATDHMTTHTGEKISPYFNAGSFVVRPEVGLLKSWWRVFLGQMHSADFLPFYSKDKRYPIFLHQAIFTGVILAALDKGQRLEFGPRINYPLHLHQEIPPDLRAESINDLVTVRCESILDEPGWNDHLPIHEPLLSWLENQHRLIRKLSESL